MRVTRVLLYREEDGTVPVRDWLDGLQAKAQLRCLAMLAQLEQLGHELRRPMVDNLGDGVYELRAKVLNVNYRMLYFFHGRQAVVVPHGFAKQEAKVPKTEIEHALRRRAAFERSPTRHTFVMES
jgi:phage-related protein